MCEGRFSVLIRSRHRQPAYYDGPMLRYYVAFYLPHAPGEMVVAEVLDFPGAVTQGFDLPDARLMIASALGAGCDTLWSEDMQHGMLIEERLRIRNPFV